MAEILHDFPIFASPARVFAAFSTPAGLDSWWTLRAKGVVQLDGTVELNFGPEYDWLARVTEYEDGRSIEYEITQAMPGWQGSRVGARFAPVPGGTEVRFYHRGWPEASDHFRVSSYCWAMYLRILKRHLEFGEVVPYADRLNV